MAGTGVGKFSSTAGSNTANMTVNFAENMAPSNVNNAARELMGHMRDMYEQLGDGYFEFGDGDGTYTVARSDADTITITSSSDISSVYFAGRKIRITDGGANVVEGTIASSSHSSTTQTVNLTGISLASGTPTKVELGIDTASFGGRVILDDDGDTYIEAPTDDTIDIYAGGAKDVTISANAVNILSGTTLTIDSGATITNSGTASGFGSNVPSSADGQALGSASAEWSDLYLADGGIIYFGNDQDVTLTHVADSGLNLKSIATGDDKPITLTLQTGETDLAANDVIGKIAFQAPDEGTGTDAILVSAAIQAVAEGDHSSSSNATRLEFMTGSSEAATSQMTISSGGTVGIGAGVPGDLGVGLHIKTADSGASVPANYDEIVIENSDHAGMSILTGTDKVGAIRFGDSGDNDIGGLIYNHDGNSLTFKVNASDAMSIASSGATTITVADNSDTLTLVSTDADANSGPNLNLYRNSANPADSDHGGEIAFNAKNDAGEIIKYGKIRLQTDDVSDGAETGRFDISTMFAGSEVSRFMIKSDEIVVNQNGVDFDFRVEGDSKANLFHIDAGNDDITIGGTTNDGLLTVNHDAAGEYTFSLNNSVASGNVYAMKATYTGQAPDNNTSFFYWGNDTATGRFGVYSDGDVVNHDNSYGSISDERIKQDIRDANSQWDDIKAVKVRNFKKKDDVRQYADKAWEQIGVIAQELETAGMDKLIKHANPTDSDIKSSSEFGTLYEDGDSIPEDKKIGDIKEIKTQVKKVSYSVLYMKAIKALQEAQSRIETLETKVAALEG